jgi:nucleoside-diphosphate-sugar epimerase
MNDKQSEPTGYSGSGTILVTGAAGHLGANLVRRLLDDGQNELRVLLREGSNNTAMDGLDVERVYGDLRELPTLRAATHGVEAVYHCAANVSTIEGNAAHKREVYDCNVLGTQNLLRAARDSGVARTVVTGSFSAVGRHDETNRPAAEVVPIYPFEPKLPYARTKEMVEHESLKAVAEGQDVVVATSCAILGPADYKPSRMGRTLLDFGWGKLPAYIPGGFEFVAARDICEGHVLAMKRGRRGQKYTISSQFMTVDELLGLFERVTGQPKPALRLSPTVMAGIAEVSSFVLSNFFPDKPQRFTPGAVRILRMQRRADISKAKRELGYEPTSLLAAVEEAWADFERRELTPKVPLVGRSSWRRLLRA